MSNSPRLIPLYLVVSVVASTIALSGQSQPGVATGQKAEILRHLSIYQAPGEYCAWPSIVRSAGGDLLLLFTRSEEHLGPDGAIMLSRSTDGGKSWLRPTVVRESPLDDRESGVTLLRDGRILGHFWSTAHTRKMYEALPPTAYEPEILQRWIRFVEGGEYGRAAEQEGPWEALTTDGGRSWMRPRRGHDSVHGGIELAQGTILIASYRRESGIAVYASDSVQAPWRRIASVSSPIPESLSFGEPHILQLPSGRVIMMIRATAIPYNDQDPRCVLWETYSDDGGRTWVKPFATPLWGFPPHLTLLADGRVLCSYGYRRPPFGERACLSKDGVTWRLGDEVVLRDDAPNGDLGYPASVELEPGTVLTVYYQPDVPPGTKQRMSPPDPTRTKPGILGTLWRVPTHTSEDEAEMNPATRFPESAAALEAFTNPPAAYRTAPLWVWNDRMTPGLIDTGLVDLHKHGIGGVFIHPRPGLITPYLSEEWLSLCQHAVRTAAKLGMNAWIYDENSYPSGFAGGLVPERMPDAKRTGLKMTKAREIPANSDPIVVLERDETGFRDITSTFRGRPSRGGEYWIFTRIYEEPRPWHGGFTYVDLLRPEVTREFIDVTMNAYKRVIGEEFGKTVPGVFQDEAEVSPPRGQGAEVVSYTPALFETFSRKWGYDLRTSLPSLFEEIGDWRRVRHDFYATILELFINGWARQYLDYCTAHDLKLTGHYWEHAWPEPFLTPDNMALAAYAHIPGIDVLMNEFRLDPDAQFGNARSVREIRSVANQLGRERTLSETFGASGWDLTFADQKRIADWQYALGVNLVNQHLTYVTIAGARKRDHPLSFSYHEPWWREYNVLSDYFGRLSVALTSGEQINRILILEPTTTGWMYARPGEKNRDLDTLGKTFQNYLNTLESSQIEYDLGSEDLLRNHASAHDRKLVVGRRSYDLLVLPPALENLEEATATLLLSFLKSGGKVLCSGEPPAFVAGRKTDRIVSLAAKYPEQWIRAANENPGAEIDQILPPALEFRSKSGEIGSPLLFHHRRTLQDCELLFLANTGKEPYSGEILARGRSAERWDPFTGASSPYPAAREADRLRIPVSIPEGGSLLLALRSSGEAAPTQRLETREEIKSEGELLIRRERPNVLTLDHCDLTLDGKTEEGLYFYQAQERAFQHHGLGQNPWDNAVQFRSRVLEQDRFPAGSGFTATFHVTVAEGVDRSTLRAVVERPGIFRVAVNGTPVDPIPGEWWLDRSFGLFDIGRFAREGENLVTVTSGPFTIHSELEPIYILGDFSLQKKGGGFEVIPPRTPQIGPWNGQGMPFYAEGIGYTRGFEVGGMEGGTRRHVLRLGRWNGSVATVKVNDREAGVIAFAPFECDVTKLIRPGLNRVTVTVIGTLKNTLGPHHNAPPPGRAWPAQFQQGPREGHGEYSTIGYGLFEEFTLWGTGIE